MNLNTVIKGIRWLQDAKVKLKSRGKRTAEPGEQLVYNHKFPYPRTVINSPFYEGSTQSQCFKCNQSVSRRRLANKPFRISINVHMANVQRSSPDSQMLQAEKSLRTWQSIRSAEGHPAN
jgi:hypothetical protein